MDFVLAALRQTSNFIHQREGFRIFCPFDYVRPFAEKSIHLKPIEHGIAV